VTGERFGYRGYIASRPVAGQRIPQHVQNLVVREFAARRRCDFLLSATEYALPECFVVLEGLLQQLEAIEGIILYSLFMLPRNIGQRRRVYEQLIATDAVLYAAVEDYRIAGAEDISRIEDVLRIAKLLETCPRELT